MKNRKKIIVMLFFILSSTLLFGCGDSTDNTENQNGKFSYNIIKKEGNFTKEEIITNNLNEILNTSRGYITAWDKCDIDFMNESFDNTINGNIKKEDFIRAYRKNPQRMVMKKFLTKIDVLGYSEKIATVKMNYTLRKTNPFTRYKDNKGEITLTFVHKEKWIITDIQTVVNEN